MIELEPAHYDRAMPLFGATRYGALAHAVLEGNARGRVFVDDPARPAAGLVVTLSGYSFLAGEPPGEPFIGSLYRLYSEQLIQATVRSGERQFLLFYPSGGWESPLRSVFQEKGPLIIRKARLVLGPTKAGWDTLWRQVIPEGLQMRRIDERLLSRADNPLAATVRAMWSSPAAFLERGAGFALFRGEEMVSHCFSVLAGAGEWEIGIATEEPYRGRGLAYLTASAFIEHCLGRDIVPVWGCFPENVPSYMLAKRLGFEDDWDFPICFWEEPHESAA